MRKVHRFVFLVLLCVVTAGLWTFSQARADSALQSGVSGQCTWTYAMVNNVKTLTIKPTDGDYGTLAGNGWNGSQHKKDTKRVVVEGTVEVGSSALAMFQDFSQATDMDLQGLDVSEVTDMGNMFRNCSALTTLHGPADWNVAKVKNMNGMFHNCKALTEVDVRDWNVGNVEDMAGMFQHCEALTKLDVKNWNVSKVTKMGYMFNNCSSLTKLDAGAWQTGKVTDMWAMFCNCSSLTTLAIGNWDVSKVVIMNSIFKGCKALTTLDVSKWNLSSAQAIKEMFSGCSAFTTLDLSGWGPLYPLTAHDHERQVGIFNDLRSLVTIYLGVNNNMPFGATSGTLGSVVWQQINVGEGGTEDNPKGQFVGGGQSLYFFHMNRKNRKTDREGYVRVAPTKLKINFLKGNPAVQGEMQPQEYKPGEKKPLSPNSFTWGSSKFLGWKGSDNKDYLDKASYEYPGRYKRVTQPGEVPPLEILDLTAQWDEVAVLTFEAEPHPPLKLELSHSKQRIDSTHRPKVCQLTVKEGNLDGKEIWWTVKSGGADPTWICKGDRIRREDIEAAAKKDGHFVDTTFLARAVDACKITLDANLPSGVTALTNPSALDDITVEKGKEATLPTDLECGPNYRFTGWDTKQDGTGTRYNIGKVTPTADIKLYAQWKKVAHIKCVKKENSNLQFEKENYAVVEDTKDSLAFKVKTGVAPGQKVKWTVKEGGNKQNSDWSHLGSELPDAKVREVAVKDKKLVDTTFQAETVDICKVTLDANLPSGVTALTKPSALDDITVEKGKEATLPTDLECGPSYRFTGWDTKKDGTGTRYNTGKITPTADIKLYAQWEKLVHIKCIKKEGSSLQFDKESYTVKEKATDSLAFKVKTGVASGQKVKWTVKEGGNKQNSDWFHLGSELPDAKVREVAVKDKKLVDTTFQAELLDFCKVTLDANLPSGVTALTKPSALNDITIEKGKEATLPTDLECGPNYRFTGWDTKQNGTGTRYNTGKVTPTADIKLYAQWESVAPAGSVTLKYEAKDTDVTLERTSEKVAPGANPKGCRVTSDIPSGKVAKWTVKAGTARTDWSSVGTTPYTRENKGGSCT